MPSPQMVVASVTVEDAVTGNRLGISYRYHHGVYDGAEREFRGFALVEQIDREADRDDPLPLAPVLVRRLYHTGLDVDLRDHYPPLPEPALWPTRSPPCPGRAAACVVCSSARRPSPSMALPRPYLVQETAYRVFPGRAHALARSTGASRRCPITSRSTHLERGDERRIVETTHDLRSAPRARDTDWPWKFANGRTGDAAPSRAPHEMAQTPDLERFTRTQYVHRDEPEGTTSTPTRRSYLVGMPARGRAGMASTGTSETLLARERYFYDGEAYKGLGYPGTAARVGG